MAFGWFNVCLSSVCMSRVCYDSLHLLGYMATFMRCTLKREIFMSRVCKCLVFVVSRVGYGTIVTLIPAPYMPQT